MSHFDRNEKMGDKNCRYNGILFWVAGFRLPSFSATQDTFKDTSQELHAKPNLFSPTYYYYDLMICGLNITPDE